MCQMYARRIDTDQVTLGCYWSIRASVTAEPACIPGSSVTRKGRCAGLDRGYVHLGTGVPHEVAYFVLVIGAFWRFVEGTEFDGPLADEQATLGGGQNVQAAPAEFWLKREDTGSGVGVPGLKQVVSVADRVGGVARTHRLLGCRRRRGSAAVQGAAALVIEEPCQAWTVLRSHGPIMVGRPVAVGSCQGHER